ncbi:MAG TPA: hypothetical protein VE111_00345 [Bradyrhizobium sp.]|nr:hypothetical protein [Bradyrhizobium sp.]
MLAAVVLAWAPQALAGEHSGLVRRASCTLVRFYVAKYSAEAAEMWARSHGATEAEIEAARRCIQGWPVQAATSISTTLR